jgi:hypothetical protein
MRKQLTTPVAHLSPPTRANPGEENRSSLTRRCKHTATARLIAPTGLLLLGLLSATGCTVPSGDPGTLEGAVIDGVTSGISSAIGALLETFIITLAT